MTHAGRKPLGPALVEHLDGSQRAKQRLEVILATIAGQLTIDQASEQLGIKPAMFYRLRTEVLEAGLARLEPRPIGRPPQSATAEERKSEGLQLEVGRAAGRTEARTGAGRDRPLDAAPRPRRTSLEKKRPISRPCRSHHRLGSNASARNVNRRQ